MGDEEKNKDLIKAAMKEAIKEWMNEKFQEFGQWSFYGILVAFFGALVYIVLSTNIPHK